MKTFVCGKILLVKLFACYIHSLAVALVLRPSFSLAFARLFMDPIYGPCIKIFIIVYLYFDVYKSCILITSITSEIGT